MSLTSTSLFIAPSQIKTAGDYCVLLRAGSFGTYPSFWTFDKREAEIFLAKASARAEELGRLWQNHQFTALDHIFQEIEDETLKERRTETTGFTGGSGRSRSNPPD